MFGPRPPSGQNPAGGTSPDHSSTPKLSDDFKINYVFAGRTRQASVPNFTTA